MERRTYPSWLREFAACLLGYFWLPCPLCGKMFAGFECGKRSLPRADMPGHGRICCKWCG
jgi:hypothetical protein